MLPLGCCFGGTVLHCQQTGRPTTEKEEFHELLNKVVKSKVLVKENFNDHADCDVGGFGEVHRSSDIKQVNDVEFQLMD